MPHFAEFVGSFVSANVFSLRLKLVAVANIWPPLFFHGELVERKVIRTS